MQQVTSLSLGLDRISTYMYTFITLSAYASSHENVNVSNGGSCRAVFLSFALKGFNLKSEIFHEGLVEIARGDQGPSNELRKIFIGSL